MKNLGFIYLIVALASYTLYVLWQTWLCSKPVDPTWHIHFGGRLQCMYWHKESWLKVMCRSPWLWYQKHKQLWTLQSPEGWGLQVPSSRDPSLETGLGKAILAVWQSMLITSSLVLIGLPFKTIWFTEVLSSLQPTRGSLQNSGYALIPRNS